MPAAPAPQPQRFVAAPAAANAPIAFAPSASPVASAAPVAPQPTRPNSAQESDAIRRHPFVIEAARILDAAITRVTPVAQSTAPASAQPQTQASEDSDE